MIDVGTLVMKVDADTKKFERGTSTVNKGMDSINRAMKTVGKTVAVGAVTTGAAVGAIGLKSLATGADAEEMLNKYNVVFNGMTNTVDKWAEEYSKSVGRSVFATKEYLSNIADLQMGLGMTQDEAFDLSKKIVELGTDLASFNNLQDDEAVEALSKAMLGEAESAKKLGLLLNVDRVKDYAKAQGLVYNELTDARKAQLVYELAVSQSQNAIGDAERSSDSYTNQMKKLKLGIEDASATLGMKLIPVATDVVSYINTSVLPSMDGWIDKAFEMSEDVVGSFDDVKGWWDENGEGLKSKGKDVLNGIKIIGEDLGGFLTDDLIPIFGNVASKVDSEWPNIKTTAKDVYEGIEDVIEPVVDLLGGEDGLISRIIEVNTTAEGTLPKVKSAFIDNLGIVGDIVGGIVDSVDALDNLLLNIDAKLPEPMKSGGIAGIFDLSEGFKALTGMDISNPLGGIAQPAPATGGGTNLIINVNGPVSSERDVRRVMQSGIEELKRYGVKVP